MDSTCHISERGVAKMAEIADITFGTDGWRGVIGDDFTYASLRRAADAAGRVFAQDNPGGLIVVGYDTRFEAGAFARAAAEVLASHGLQVAVSDRYIPTPALCWAIANDSEACGGVMLTASHNPAPYLGLKVRMADGGASPVAFTKRIESELRDEPPTARGSFGMVDILTRYVQALCRVVDGDAIRAAGLKVAVDSLYGAGQGYLAQALGLSGVEVTEIHKERNPGFGGLHPEPIPPHINEVQRLVRAQDFDAGFVTDGDADRIGAVDERGDFVNPHRILSLIARHLAEGKGLQGRIVKTLSTSVLVDRIGAHLGLEVTTTPVGFKWIYEEMLSGDVLIGGEESGGIGIPGHVRERDGLLMALLLAEMMAQRGRTLGELVEDLFAVTGPMEYSRRDLKLTAEQKSAFVSAMPNMSPTEIAGIPVLRIDRTDGIKFLLADDAWLLLRTSGTEPLVRVYAEASTMGVVDDLLDAGVTFARGG